VYRPDPVFLNRFAAARLVLIFGMVSLLEQKIEHHSELLNRTTTVFQKPMA
jgi:hypothetical protein